MADHLKNFELSYAVAVMSGGSHPKRSLRGGLLLCALAAALLLIGCGGDSDSDSNVAATAESTIRETGPTVAVLRPVGNSEATGTAHYSKKADGFPLIRLRAHGLEPVSGDRQYIVWQKRSRNDMVMMATWYVGKDGRLVEDMEPNISFLQYLERGLRTKLMISRINNNDRLYEPGASRNSYEHNVIGTPVLEGQFEGALVGTPKPE
jgi:hypothetical protein